ncbi:MAG: serine/threonine-protein kinase [Planctomycetota bacterium]
MTDDRTFADDVNSPPPVANRFFPGARLGRYEIVRLLGKGAMGSAWLARQLDLQRHVVVKVLSELMMSPAILARFDREARTAATISSDNVVKVFDVGRIEDTPLIVMELVDGQSVDGLLDQRGALAWQDAARIVRDAAAGLAAAHERGILHRDVKPGNILLTRDGRAKVSDFGIAHWDEDGSLTRIGAVIGTPAYMSPEQASGAPVDARTDIYALGVTFYQLLTGCLPYQGATVSEILSKKLAGRALPPCEVVPSIPPQLDDLCLSMMSVARERRPSSMNDVIARLGGTTRPVVSTPPPSSAPFVAPTPAPSEPADPDQLPVPGRFNRFQLERVIGRGGMGVVYFARELSLQRPVVIKVIKSSLARKPEVVERMEREARAAARISSDFVVRIFDAGREGSIPFIVMEYVDGVPASSLLEARGSLPAAEAAQIVLAAAQGLGAAHALGILHRDVKPANLLIARDGRIKVADFGLAKDSSESALTAPGALVGTPAYMSPEQLDALPLDARSDIYSLGVTFYELLTGKLPFEGANTMQVLIARTKPFAPPSKHVPGLAKAAEKACLAMLEANVKKRPKDMDAVVKLVGALVGG